MIVAYVEPGICGFNATIRVIKIGPKNVRVSIISDCKQVIAFSNQLQNLSIKDILRSPIHKNPIYDKAGLSYLHASCPIPCAVLKAAELELELALRQDVKFEFRDENRQTDDAL